MTETTKTQSPYIRARQEWDERFGDQIKSKNNWRLAAFVSTATTFLCVTGMVAIGYRSNTVPYVVALDDVGRAVPVIPARQVAVRDVRLQEAVVARWVTDLRMIVTDAVAQRRLVDEVYAQTGQNSAASAIVTEFYSKNSPFDLLKKQTVDASVESIVQQSPKTYEVTWTEVTRDLVGQFVASHRFRAFVSVTTQEVTDAKQALVNPLGLYVTNLTWGEVVSTSGPSSAVNSDQTTNGDSSKLIWIAALMIAAQAAGATGSSQQSPAVTAQQQELSHYNFKAAAAALNAQTNQSAPKASPSAPIPPLQVPPLTSQKAIVQSSPDGGTPAEKSSEVPPKWKPPHAALNNAAVSAAAVAHQWETGVGTPTPGPDGRVLYVFGQGMPVMVCAPLRVCAVELQPGEHLQSQPQIGDSRRWEITPVMAGTGLDQTPLLIVKPW